MRMPPSPPPVKARAAKLIARAGLASRREAEAWLRAGRVHYQGKRVENVAQTFPGPEGLAVDGRPLPALPAPALWLFHKPLARLVARHARRGEKVIYDDLPETLHTLLPVGRLDRMSCGLLLLTNHGGLARHLELPASGYQRIYHVEIKGRRAIEEALFAPVRKGMRVEGENFRPAEVKILALRGRRARLAITLREGRKREIRRMMRAVGLEVEDLLRIAYGPFRLGRLPAGKIRAFPPEKLPAALPRFFAAQVKAGRRAP